MRSRRCKRGVGILIRKGRSLEHKLWEDRMMTLIRKPEDLHKMLCKPTGNRFLQIHCFTEKNGL